MAETYLTTESKKKILFVLTSHSKLLGGKSTGWYLSEAAHPYYILAPHFIIEWASPNGGKAPLDPSSVAEAKNDKQCVRFLNDEMAKQSGYENTLKLSAVNSKEYEAIFFVGGHGPMFDLACHNVSIKLVENFWNEGKIVSAICHGPAALINVQDVNKKSILNGRKVTSFSNEEEEEVGLTDAVPFLLETKMKEIGGLYAKNDRAWGAYVTIDGQLILGANPASAETLGKALLAALKPNLDQSAIHGASNLIVGQDLLH